MERKLKEKIIEILETKLDYRCGSEDDPGDIGLENGEEIADQILALFAQQSQEFIKMLEEELAEYVKEGDDAGADVLKDLISKLKNVSPKE